QSDGNRPDAHSAGSGCSRSDVDRTRAASRRRLVTGDASERSLDPRSRWRIQRHLPRAAPRGWRLGDEVRLHHRRGCRVPGAHRRRVISLKRRCVMNTMPVSQPIRALVLAVAAAVLPAGLAAAGPAQFVIVNTNAPGVGFNDPTPVAPVGGNTGTTLGQQRLNSFQYAA